MRKKKLEPTIYYGISQSLFNATHKLEENVFTEEQFIEFKKELKNLLAEEFPNTKIVIYNSSFKTRDEIQAIKVRDDDTGLGLLPEIAKERIGLLGRKVFKSKTWRQKKIL